MGIHHQQLIRDERDFRGPAVRLSLLFSLAIGLVALLAVSERMPRWLDSDDALAKPSLGSVNSQITRSKSTPIKVLSSEQTTSSNKEHGHIYRWRDARGGIHIATEPPPENVQAVVMPFVRERPVKSAERAMTAAKASTNTVVPDVSPAALLSVYTPEGFDDLLDRIEETAHKLHERNTQLEMLEKQL